MKISIGICFTTELKICIFKKKQPIIYNNNQNYKFDDDEILKKNTKDTQKITHSHKDNLKKVSVKK